MKKFRIVLVFAAIIAIAGLEQSQIYANDRLHDTSVLQFGAGMDGRKIPNGWIFANASTMAILVEPGDARENPYATNVILLKGTAGIQSLTPAGVTLRAISKETMAKIRVLGLAKISIEWNGGIEIKPLQGTAILIIEHSYDSTYAAFAGNKEIIRIDSYGRIHRDNWHWWNEYTDFEKWCLGYDNNQGAYGGSSYDERAVEDRGYDEYGNYVVVRTYDPDVRVYYNITYYYVSDPWWWYRAEYGRFEYVYGYGWVFVPYPTFWHRHCYYHEAPPTGHYYHGIIIKEKEGQSAPQIPKERVVPYRPKETPDRNDPAKYKVIRRTDSDNPPSGNGQNQAPGHGGNGVVPREPREPAEPQKPGSDEPKRREPDGYTPREPREPQNGDSPQVREPQRKEPEQREPQSPPPNGNGQVRPKEPQGGGQTKPPEKEQEKKPVKKLPEKNPDPKKEKT